MSKCGTYAGYQAHKTRGEAPCKTCRDANTAYGRAWRTRQPERVDTYKTRAATYSQIGHQKWRGQNPARISEYHYLNRYGLTNAQRNEIFEWQGRACACCGANAEHDRSKQWQIDHSHSHSTGQIRGILCARCNRLLAQMDDCAAGIRAHCERLLAYLAGAGDFGPDANYIFDGDRAPKPRREA